MITLESTDTLEIKLAGAVTTNELPVVVAYADIRTSDMKTVGSGRFLNKTNGTAAVTICTAPSSGNVRVITKLLVRNEDTASATITLTQYNGTTRYNFLKESLSVDDTLQDDGR